MTRSRGVKIRLSGIENPTLVHLRHFNLLWLTPILWYHKLTVMSIESRTLISISFDFFQKYGIIPTDRSDDRRKPQQRQGTSRQRAEVHARRHLNIEDPAFFGRTESCILNAMPNICTNNRQLSTSNNFVPNLSSVLYTCKEHSTNRPFLCKTKPKLKWVK
jgi:hypothetical protein